MKRFLISGICLACVVTLAGCTAKPATQTLTALDNQLDRVQSIVSSTSINEVASVSPFVTLESSESQNSIQALRALSNENMLREEELRQKILSATKQLKSRDTTKLKLGNRNIKALKEASNNISQYCTCLNKTKSEVKSTVSKIKRNLKIEKMNIEVATSAYITLSGKMNERYAYMKNIYDNLEQACIILKCDSQNEGICEKCDSQENICPEEIEIENQVEEEEKTVDNDSQKKGSFKIIKNIDSYNNYNDAERLQNSNSNANTPANNIHGTEIPPISMPINRPTHYINQPPYNHRHGNYYGYYGGRVNPGRNTDTYYSFNRNIDTYRFNPSFYNNYYNY